MWRTRKAPYRDDAVRGWIGSTWLADSIWSRPLVFDTPMRMKLLVVRPSCQNARSACPELTSWLANNPVSRALGAMMLDMYPKGPLGDGKPMRAAKIRLTYLAAGLMATDTLGNSLRSGKYNCKTFRCRGGARANVVFFASTNLRHVAPRCTRFRLVKWSSQLCLSQLYTYGASASAEPGCYDGPVERTPTGVLLHTKFLDRCHRQICRRKS